MADNEQKNYFSFLDIPNGNGGTTRWHAKDAEAQAAIQNLPSAASIQTCEDIVSELI